MEKPTRIPTVPNGLLSFYNGQCRQLSAFTVSAGTDSPQNNLHSRAACREMAEGQWTRLFGGGRIGLVDAVPRCTKVRVECADGANRRLVETTT